MADPKEMYQCQVSNCGFIFDPEKKDRKNKLPKGTKFQDVPEKWRCPVCGGSPKGFRSLG